jgi:hypothetical protein
MANTVTVFPLVAVAADVRAAATKLFVGVCGKCLVDLMFIFDSASRKSLYDHSWDSLR